MKDVLEDTLLGFTTIVLTGVAGFLLYRGFVAFYELSLLLDWGLVAKYTLAALVIIVSLIAGWAITYLTGNVVRRALEHGKQSMR